MQDHQCCPICRRNLGTKNISKHHLLPKSQGGKHSETILIHNICHQKIHSLFTAKDLKANFDTVEKLTANEQMQKFIKWVAKKDPSFYQKNKKSKWR